MTLVEGAQGGYEADGLASKALFLQPTGDVAGPFKYDHFSGFKRVLSSKTGLDGRFYNKKCTFANYLQSI